MSARAALLVAALLGSAAHADPLVLRATGGVVYDDNVFRLPDGVSPLLGNGRDDTIAQAQAALHYDNTFGRQNVKLDASATRYAFQQHKELSFTGLNIVGVWDWRFASRFYGSLSYDLQRRQSNFAEYRGIGRNLITIKQPFAELRYKPAGTLFAYMNYRRVTGSNSSPLLEANNYKSNVYGAGVGYDLRNFGNLKLGVKRTDRSFPTDQVVIIGGVPTAFRNDYQLDEIEASTLFPLSIKTAIAGRVAYTRRRVETAPQRDFSGLTGRLAIDYRPSPLWSFELAARRELSSEDDIQTNFATVREVSSYVEYRPREFWTLRVDGEIERRNFKGFATVAPTIGRDDRTRSLTLTSGYAWRLGSRLDLSLRREHRNSTIDPLDYNATTGAATLTLAFGGTPVDRPRY